MRRIISFVTVVTLWATLVAAVEQSMDAGTAAAKELDHAEIPISRTIEAKPTIIASTHEEKEEETEKKKRAPNCFKTKEMPQDNNYLAYSALRSNIVEDRRGLPFALQINVVDVLNCSPLAGAAVDIWHADSSGRFSGWSQTDSINLQKQDNTTYLRGVQVSDNSGNVNFNTFFPGWYDGRSTHIHVKVKVGGNVTSPVANSFVTNAGTYSNGRTAHTGQILFPDALVGTVAQYVPYNALKPYMPMLNDPEWNNDTSNIVIVQDNSGISWDSEFADPNFNDGLFGFVTIGVNSSATPAIMAQPNMTSTNLCPTGASMTQTASGNNDPNNNCFSSGFQFSSFFFGLVIGAMVGCFGMFKYVKANPDYMERHRSAERPVSTRKIHTLESERPAKFETKGFNRLEENPAEISSSAIARPQPISVTQRMQRNESPATYNSGGGGGRSTTASPIRSESPSIRSEPKTNL